MAFTIKEPGGVTYTPGWFLGEEECDRETREMQVSAATRVAALTSAPVRVGVKVVKCGTVYPTNDSNAIGIVYEDVDVTMGNMPGSVVTKGKIIKDRLAETINAGAVSALEAKGFTFVDSAPTVTRPNWSV